MGARHRVGIGLSYRPARLHELAELMHWNRFLGSINVQKYGLSGQLYSLAETPQPPTPAFGLIYGGAIGQPRLDDISLWPLFPDKPAHCVFCNFVFLYQILLRFLIVFFLYFIVNIFMIIFFLILAFLDSSLPCMFRSFHRFCCFFSVSLFYSPTLLLYLPFLRLF